MSKNESLPPVPSVNTHLKLLQFKGKEAEKLSQLLIPEITAFSERHQTSCDLFIKSPNTPLGEHIIQMAKENGIPLSNINS